MVSEKPPRRSKTNKEPVTIDLTAEEGPAVAEPVRANDTDEKLTPAEAIAASGDESTATKEPLSSEPTDATAKPEAAAKSADAKAKPDTAEPATAATADATTDGTKTETPRFDDDPETEQKKPDLGATSVPPRQPTTGPSVGARTGSTPPPTEPRPLQRAAPATSTLVAAGIFGGIVALLLAGSMQYAGVLPGGSSSGSDSDVSAELASLRQEIAALANPSGDLESRIAALESSSATAAPDEALTQRLAALEGELSGIRSATESNTGRLQQAEAQIADRGPEQMAARAVAAAALKSAIDRGGAFVAELETYKTLAADDPSIVQLEPLATRGVLSRVELQRQASDVANAMIDAVTQPDPNLGIGERLLASAMSVVKVRKVGDVEGETPDAYIARFENKLRSGDLPGAASEWAALPEPAKAASQSFKQELDARIEVENLISGTLTRAITGTQG
jgi:hypothetical protein